MDKVDFTKHQSHYALLSIGRFIDAENWKKKIIIRIYYQPRHNDSERNWKWPSDQLPEVIASWFAIAQKEAVPLCDVTTTLDEYPDGIGTLYAVDSFEKGIISDSVIETKRLSKAGHVP